MLFSDVLLITVRKDPLVEMYDLEAVVWVRDMKLRYYNYDSTSKGQLNPSANISSAASTTTDEEYSNQSILSFEIISCKSRTRPQMNFLFLCDNEGSKNNWIEEIENTLLAYHRETTVSRQLGWYHDFILGSIHSAAYTGIYCIANAIRYLSSVLQCLTSTFTGDLSLLRRYLKSLESSGVSIDILDKSGMTALHWAILKSREGTNKIHQLSNM